MGSRKVRHETLNLKPLTLEVLAPDKLVLDKLVESPRLVVESPYLDKLYQDKSYQDKLDWERLIREKLERERLKRERFSTVPSRRIQDFFCHLEENLFKSLPRAWELFGFLLPRSIRDSAYEAGRNELLEDYVLARKKYRTRWARHWLVFCFTTRTALLWSDCLRVWGQDKAVRAVFALFPVLGRWFSRT